MSRSRIFLRRVLRLTPNKIRGADLIAAGRRQSRRQQRMFDLAQDPVIEPRRRQPVLKTGKISRQMPLDCGTEIFIARAVPHRRRGSAGWDNSASMTAAVDRLLRI